MKEKKPSNNAGHYDHKSETVTQLVKKYSLEQNPSDGRLFFHQPPTVDNQQ